MPYKVLQDGATLQRPLGTLRGRDGNEYTETESIVYAEGDFVDDSALTDEFKERLKNGDPLASSLVEEVSDKDVKDALAESEDADENDSPPIPTTDGGDQPYWPDYADLNAATIVERMKSLTPGQVQRVKDYEATHGNGRKAIAEFEVGSGQVEAAVAGEAPSSEGEHVEAEAEGSSSSSKSSSKGSSSKK